MGVVQADLQGLQVKFSLRNEQDRRLATTTDSHTLSLSHSLTHTLSLTHSHPLSLSLTLSLSHSLTHSLSLSHSLTLSSLTLSLSHPLSLSHSLPHASNLLPPTPRSQPSIQAPRKLIRTRQSTLGSHLRSSRSRLPLRTRISTPHTHSPSSNHFDRDKFVSDVGQMRRGSGSWCS